MKRLWITLLVLVLGVPLLVGGYVGYNYYKTDEESLPEVALYANGITVANTGYEWSQPVIFGLAYKDFISRPSLEATNVGTIREPQLRVDFPKGYTSIVRLELDGEILWTGVADEWDKYVFTKNGSYVLDVTSEKMQAEGEGYGSFNHRFAFTVNIDPVLQVNRYNVLQGGVVALKVENLTDDVTPTAYSEICDLTFVDTGDGSKTAYLPIAYNRGPGDYTVSVYAGAESWDVRIHVVAANFEVQNLTIDTSNEQITEANSAAAYEEYRNVMYPIFEEADPERYWEGPFIRPVETEQVNTSFGLFRYTNGGDTPTRHAGMDYDGNTGDEVVAPNHGRVVLAQHLLNTGNTLVLEHGGGLKTYYFHLDGLNVEEGDIVSKGDLVGWVGSTGYSTGPHLHYEVRIMNQAIDPVALYSEEESGLLFSGE